jgi:hypothetical protein
MPRLAPATLALAALTLPAFATPTPTPIAELAPGTTVTVTGTVERITDEDEFLLADATGRVQVYIGPGIVPFDVGERVTLDALVDREGAGIELYARAALRADGSRVTFDHRGE